MVGPLIVSRAQNNAFVGQRIVCNIKLFIFEITIVEMKENIVESALTVRHWCMLCHKLTLNYIHYCIPAVLD